MTTTMTIQLDSDLKQRLDRLAAASQQSSDALASDVLKDFVELNEWQSQELQDAIKEADRGEFATATQVKETLGKWGVDAD
ncbi:CopG family ribbon-helix-helix protein [Oceanobacter kriegii]|uniref:CopG family ribbon-helix-helix protein n=1 Tax=Oceanobacter kriegii TaxID=64972 RepID=UPI0004271BF2|nr:hypothetical protein [Oceanobacter kriegii]